MKEYIVTRKRMSGLAKEMPGKTFPVYRIAADSPQQAKKTACRLDKQDECFWKLYIATPAAKTKRRPAATDRRLPVPNGTIEIGTKTTINIPYTRGKYKGVV